MDINNALNAHLTKFMKSTPGVIQIILSDATGLVLSKVTKSGSAETFSDFEGIASISTAIYLGMSELKLGELGFSQMDFPYFNLCLFGVTKEYVLVAITHKNASLKKLKANVKGLSVNVSEQLELLKMAEMITLKQEEVYEKSVGLSQEEYEQLLDELTF